jgi:hypothetical protein
MKKPNGKAATKQRPSSKSGITRRQVLEALAVVGTICSITGVSLRDLLPSPSVAPVTPAAHIAIQPATGYVRFTGYGAARYATAAHVR